MFVGPAELLRRWSQFLDDRLRGVRQTRRCTYSALAARDIIEHLAEKSGHPAVVRLVEAVRSLETSRLGRELADRQWWAAVPAPPTRPPTFDSSEGTAVAGRIWEQSVEAGLTPVDVLSFASVRGHLSARLRFDVVAPDRPVFRPFVELTIEGVERMYYDLLGTQPPEVFTPTFTAAVGRLRPTGIHISLHEGMADADAAIARHISAFADVDTSFTGFSSIEHLLREPRFHGDLHSAWRLPLGLALEGRQGEARQAAGALVRRPHTRAGLEARRFADALERMGCPCRR
ncbi:hypothetical protein AB0J80_12250 [Actinoplanes sp. NPDC049548]|uniref:hypothetical protein n=1 Tax=Actinoplanes sp. NPDC049548 TaxID=3155152 RepID=UPI00342044CB